MTMPSQWDAWVEKKDIQTLKTQADYPGAAYPTWF